VTETLVGGHFHYPKPTKRQEGPPIRLGVRTGKGVGTPSERREKTKSPGQVARRQQAEYSIIFQLPLGAGGILRAQEKKGSWLIEDAASGKQGERGSGKLAASRHI